MAGAYQRPGWFTKNVFNRLVAGLTRSGLSVAGSRVVEVRGRRSGEWRTTPVNPLEFEGDWYLKKWAWEVGAFFQGVGADASETDVRRIAPLHPVFRISRRGDAA